MLSSWIQPGFFDHVSESSGSSKVDGSTKPEALGDAFPRCPQVEDLWALALGFDAKARGGATAKVKRQSFKFANNLHV